MAAGSKRLLFKDMRRVTAYNGPPTHTVSAGEYVMCSLGHKKSSISRGWDPTKEDYYVEAKCHEVGCTGHSMVYDKDRARAT